MLTDDGELARRCAGGDEDGWRQLVARFQRKVWNVAYQFTGRADEAEELAQEIFLHLLSALRTFDSAGSLPAWVQRVARNYAIDHYRRKRRERALVADGEEAEAFVLSARDTSRSSDPHRSLEEKDLAGWLRSVVDRLPSELGQAVILRDLQEMSYEEMAKALEIPLGTVKSRINRGRLELARLLARRREEWSAGPGPGKLKGTTAQPPRAERARPGGSARAEGAAARESGRPPRAKSERGEEPSGH